ncbi:MAG: VOC family protein [Thermoplasmata archaeon]|nr:VOC family protein [Thermoplasmata archaeon]
MDEIVSGLHAVTIHIRDIQKSRAFYRDVLGLNEISFSEARNRAVFALPGTSTFLTMHIQSGDEGGREPGTVTGLILRHPDPAAAIVEIQRRGGTVANEPRLIEFPGVKFVQGVIADPDGNEFVISNRTD